MGNCIWMQEWGLVVRAVKGCGHLLESYLLLSSWAQTGCNSTAAGCSAGWAVVERKTNTAQEVPFSMVALPRCLLSSFAMPLLAVVQLFVWPGCKQD